MERFDEVGTPVLLVLMVIGFVFFWPVGLAILCYLLWTGKLRGKRSLAMPWLRGLSGLRGSGNKSFDDHRAEVLQKLEEEQDSFAEFLDNLRNAKDKAEFDQFMASRK